MVLTWLQEAMYTHENIVKRQVCSCRRGTHGGEVLA